MAVAMKSSEKSTKTKTAVAKPAAKAAPKTAQAKVVSDKGSAAKAATALVAKAAKGVAKPTTVKAAKGVAKPTTVKAAKGQAKALTPEQRRCYVEVAAYYIAERRGFVGGDRLEDWTKAEAEIERLLREGVLNP